MIKYIVKFSSKFKKSLKNITKQGKDIDKLMMVVTKLANKEKLDMKYKNHRLIDDQYFFGCYECHIEPDWLLVYKYLESDLVLLLVQTGSHSDLF